MASDASPRGAEETASAASEYLWARTHMVPAAALNAFLGPHLMSSLPPSGPLEPAVWDSRASRHRTSGATSRHIHKGTERNAHSASVSLVRTKPSHYDSRPTIVGRRAPLFLLRLAYEGLGFRVLGLGLRGAGFRA